MSIEQMFEFNQYQLDRELFSMQFQQGSSQLKLFLDLFTGETPYLDLIDYGDGSWKLNKQLNSYQ